MGHKGHDPVNLNHGRRGKMNAGLIILRVASEKRDAHNERDGARAAQLRRNGDSVAPATPSSVPPSQQHYNLQPSTQLVVSSSRPSSRCCWQRLEEGRGGTSRRDASCAQHQLRRSSISSDAAAAAGDGAVSRDDERSTGALLLRL